MEASPFSDGGAGAAVEAVPPAAAPTSRAERITALDTLRGFALLGILLMNIVPFGMHGAAYTDPTVTGGAAGANLAVWAVLHVLAEGKMRCLFSMVFGAGVILLTSRLEARGGGADIYYRRTLWLLLFGVAHAYLLWLGDILYPYALCALILYPVRKLPAKTLLRIGGIIVLFSALAYIGLGFKTQETIAQGRAAEQAAARGDKLTPEQEEARKEFEEWRKVHRPTPEELAKDAEEWRGSVPSVLQARARGVFFFHGKPFYHPFFWDIWSMMFIGMGLMKMQVLGAERPLRQYLGMALLGYGIGIPVNSYTAWLIIRSNFDPALHAFANSTYDIGRLSIALGHLGMVMIFCQRGWLRGLLSRLGAIGQMAFSNYILQSVICAFVFTGYGFGLYGRLQRYELYYVVAAVWVLQLIASPLWLRYYRFGPLEWAWRSLTYWKRQPLRLVAAGS
jgi:uncharacterized protein